MINILWFKVQKENSKVSIWHFGNFLMLVVTCLKINMNPIEIKARNVEITGQLFIYNVSSILILGNRRFRLEFYFCNSMPISFAFRGVCIENDKEASVVSDQIMVGENPLKIKIF